MGLPPVPVGGFRDCTATITGVPNSNAMINQARNRALQFVGAAISQLNSAPAAGSVYQTALVRHFANPNAVQRNTIRTRYIRMRAVLRNNRNFICNSASMCAPQDYAFWIPQDDLIHICPRFFRPNLDLLRRALILTHEAAHDVGVDAAAGAHQPDRGTAAYPWGNVGPPVGQTALLRMNNAEAYAMFAAHVWRSTDTGRVF